MDGARPRTVFQQPFDSAACRIRGSGTRSEMDSDRPTVDRKQRFRVINGSKSSVRTGKKPQESDNSFAGDWEIPLHTWPRRIIAIVLILAASGILIYRTWWLFLAAWITRSKPMDPGVYERAVRY